MKIFSKIMVLVLSAMFIVGDCAWAQWDLKGCSEYAPTIEYAGSLESSLWTFCSNVWDGYIDFQEDGKYWTHWGFGKWTVTPEGKIHLANDYNARTYDIVLTDNGWRFEGIRNDGLTISGKLICAKYQGPGPKVPVAVEENIKDYYTELLERAPTPKELENWFRQYNQNATLADIRENIRVTPESQEKEAKRKAEAEEAAAKAAKEAEANGSALGW